MTVHLKELLDHARTATMTAEQRQAQRISFAYGNSKIENSHVTRTSIKRESEALAKKDGSPHHIG